ncbi:MAG: F0F1 ATP synthase subunit A, partial [Sedimentisphaerales bacterium]|nr:F0F1 ATP synthase subunit A [Sedimentisphaerales bacterium]
MFLHDSPGRHKTAWFAWVPCSDCPPGPWWIRPLLFFIELVGIAIRPFTLAIRLFANILAGHIVTATFFGLIIIFKSYLVAAASVLAAAAISVLELLVAF